MLLIPKNWTSFQHYKDRAPPWIKLHKGLLDDSAFQRLEKLLLKGCTSMEIIKGTGSTTPSKRRHDLKQRGWTITKVKVPGKNYHRFYGKAPKRG